MNAFSAMVTHAKRSSIDAMKVCSRVSHSIRVYTFFFCLVVLTNKPGGSSTLSGDTAFATAFASLAALYARVNSAFKWPSFELFLDKVVHKFNEHIHVFDRHLRASCDVVSATSSRVLLSCNLQDLAEVQTLLYK